MIELISLLEQKIIGLSPELGKSKHVKFIEMFSGEMNKIYLFDVGGNEVIIKQLEVKGSWNNLEREYFMLKGLRDCKVDCPNPYFFDKFFSSGPILCMEYVPGITLSREGCKSRLEDIAKLVNKLHATPLGLDKFRREDLKKYVNHFGIVEELLDYTSLKLHCLKKLEVPLSVISKVRDIHKGLSSLIVEKRDAFCGTNFVFCHGDFKSQNLILHPTESIRLIDWEHANISDPAFDVEIFLKNTRLSKSDIARFLGVYGLPDNRFIDRLEAYKSFFTLPSLLWHTDRVYNPKYGFDLNRVEKYKREMHKLIDELI